MTRRPHGGFTLLEVIVAFAVFSVSAAALFGIVRATLQQTHQATVREQAVLLAQSRLAAVAADPGLAERSPSGSDSGFNWRLSVQPFADQDRTVSQAWRLVLIEVRVDWERPDRGGSLELSTLRLVGPTAGGA